MTGGPLRVRVGHDAGVSFILRAPCELEERRRVEGNIVEGVVPAWQCCAIKIGSRVWRNGRGGARVFVLQPSETEGSVDFGVFYVRGKLEVVQRINNTDFALELWKEFRAE